MPAELERLGAGLAPGLGLLAGGVDLDVDVERGSGGWGERGAAEVELGCFFDGVDRTYYPEVGDGGGEGFAFIFGVSQFGGIDGDTRDGGGKATSMRCMEVLLDCRPPIKCHLMDFGSTSAFSVNSWA